MKLKIAIVFFVFELLTSPIASSQNIFDTSATGYYDSIGNPHTYVPSKFESYIKDEVNKSLHFSNKIILVNFKELGLMSPSTGLWVPTPLDSSATTLLSNRYMLFSYSGKKEWAAIGYVEIDNININPDSTTFFKSLPVKLSENAEFYSLRNKWDSLKNQCILPFVTKIELNGKKGYFQTRSSDMSYVNLFAIDPTHVIYQSIYEDDLNKERDFPSIKEHDKNVNFDFNYSQPTFAADIYFMKLLNSKTIFSGFKKEN